MKRLLLLMTLLIAPLWADSLLPEDPEDLFAPNQIRVGDLVTVVIQNDVRTIQQVQVQNNASSGVTNPITSLIGTVAGVAGIATEYEDENQRQELANTISRYEETVTATVVAVERDNLSLSASSHVVLDGKARKVSVTGKVRRQDVGANNRVNSNLLADARISVDGLHKSPVQPGILSRVLRFIF